AAFPELDERQVRALARRAVQPDGRYPDIHANVELFTCDFMLEVETLGPLVTLLPGTAVSHAENWFLFQGVPILTNDADVTTHIVPLLPA
ncbi:MAG TPA: hypothetical protein PLK31_26080, partial [Chloroflexota bacterium]|nr:hypothetical protein [Chloroflexota bacterium]